MPPPLSHHRVLHLLAALAVGDAALACSCAPPPPPLQALAQHEVVFRGRVLQNQAIDSYETASYFAVSRVWKGQPDPLQRSTRFKGCGPALEPGVEYLVYGPDTTCTRTRRLSEAEADLLALGAGQPVRNASLGALVRHRRYAGSWYNPERSGEGVLLEPLEDGRVAVSWLGFDPEATDRQMWLSGIGAFNAEGELVVSELTRPVGGGFGHGFQAAQVTRPVWGSMRLKLTAEGGEVYYQPRITPPPYGRPLIFRLLRLTRPPAPPVPG